jgi:hypothetical protein
VNCDSRELELMPGSVAASSVVVYDIIGTYIRPLTGKQVVYWSHILIGKFDATRFGSAGLSPWEGRHVQCLSMLLIPCPIDAVVISQAPSSLMRALRLDMFHSLLWTPGSPA